MTFRAVHPSPQSTLEHFFWRLWHVEVPGPGIEPTPQQMSPCSDNARSLTHCTTAGTPILGHFYLPIPCFSHISLHISLHTTSPQTPLPTQGNHQSSVAIDLSILDISYK